MSSRRLYPHSSSLGLLLTALLSFGVCSTRAELVPNEIQILAASQPVHSVCPLYKEVFGRSLIISPQAQGRDIHLGPLTATLKELRIILPAVLTAAGYSVRSVGESLDMLEDAGPMLSQSQESVSERIPLKYASAQDLVPLFPALFASGPRPTPAPVYVAPVPPPSAVVSGQAPPPPAVPPVPPQQSAVPQTASVFAAPDNSLHFTGTRGQLVIAKAFVASMDSQPRLVAIRAIIGHVQLGGSYQTGFDFLTLMDDTNVGNAGPRTLQAPLRAPVNSLSVYGQLGSISRYLKLSEEDSEFRTDSRPSLFVRSGSSAEITSGERLAYPQSVLTTSNGQASTSATVAYQDVVLRLSVEALVNSQDQITLKIKQTNDTVTGTTTISGNQVPNIGSQSLTTEVLLDSGSTVALGGIVTNGSQAKERGVSKLRKIPFIGRIFDVRSKARTQEELIILIEATVKQ